MQTIKPASKVLFCKPNEAENKTNSGILLGDAAEKPKTATVINSGATDYARDDVVVYKSYATTDVKLNGEQYILLHEDDVLGKVCEV